MSVTKTPNEILVCDTGRWGSRLYIENAVKSHPGKVILICEREVPEWKELLKPVKHGSLESLSDFGKIQISLSTVALFLPLSNNERIAEYNRMMKDVEKFIMRYIDDEDVLFVFDESCNTVPYLIPDLIVGKYASGKIIVAQNLDQIIFCCQTYGKEYGDRDWCEELVSNRRLWEEAWDDGNKESEFYYRLEAV